MNRKKTCITVILVCSVFLVQVPSSMAQLVSPRSSNVQFDNLLSRGTEINPVYYDEIEGSPFLENEFMPGTVVMKNGRIFENIGFRYNMHTNQIEFKDEGKILTFVNPRDLEYVFFGNHRFIYEKYFLKGKPVEGYFKVLADGYARLLVKRYAEIKSEKMPVSNFGEVNYRNYFRITEDYYITKDGQNLIPVRKQKRSLLKALEEKKTEIEAFLEASGLDIRNDVDLGEVVFYYNQLMQEEIPDSGK